MTGQVEGVRASRVAESVTVLVPVRNGAVTLRRVLDGLVGQTLSAGRIIVSDNQSSDGTYAIALEYAAAHPRITVLRQPEALSANDHFRGLFDLVETPYFMWAAHDDFHSQDFIEVLLAVLDRDIALSAVFPDLIRFTDGEDPMVLEPVEFPADTRGLSYRGRLRLVPERHVSMAVYGLWRTEALADHEWPGTDIAEDWILMWYALARGDVGHVPGPRFYYYLPPIPKSVAQRAQADGYRDMRRFSWLRVYWAGARAAVAGWSHRGGRKSVFATFVLITIAHRRVVWKQQLYARFKGSR